MYRDLDKKRATRKRLNDEYRKNNRARIREYNKKYREEHPEKFLSYRLKRKFDITVEQYQKILDDQGGVCAICFSKCVSGKPLSVDHCHSTGEVRGLLCLRCNTGLGQFQDSVGRLEQAIRYIKRP